MRRRVRIAAARLQSAAVERMGKSGPPSNPGEYPARQSGRLVESIVVRESTDGLSANVGPEADHAKYLKASGRRMMRDVLGETRRELLSILKGG